MRKIITVIVLIIILLSGAGYWYYDKSIDIVSCSDENAKALLGNLYSNIINNLNSNESFSINTFVNKEDVYTIEASKKFARCKLSHITLIPNNNVDNKLVLDGINYTIRVSDDKRHAFIKLDKSDLTDNVNIVTKIKDWINAQNKSLSPKINSNNNSIDIDLLKQKLSTIYGTLSATRINDSEVDILFNDKKILSSYAAYVNYKAMIGDDVVLVITTDPGGSMGNTSYSLIDIKPDKSVITKEITNGWSNTEFTHDVKCLMAKTTDLRPYADKTDYTLFTYCVAKSESKLDETTYMKPDSYYRDKFSSYSSKQIYNLAVSDHCFDSQSDLLDQSNVCQYGEKYCFMFRSKTHNENDHYTKILKNSCLVN